MYKPNTSTKYTISVLIRCCKNKKITPQRLRLLSQGQRYLRVIRVPGCRHLFTTQRVTFSTLVTTASLPNRYQYDSCFLQPEKTAAFTVSRRDSVTLWQYLVLSSVTSGKKKKSSHLLHWVEGASQERAGLLNEFVQSLPVRHRGAAAAPADHPIKDGWCHHSVKEDLQERPLHSKRPPEQVESALTLHMKYVSAICPVQFMWVAHTSTASRQCEYVDVFLGTWPQRNISHIAYSCMASLRCEYFGGF